MENQENNRIDPSEYSYKSGDTVEVDARVFMNLMAFLKEVEVGETRPSFLNTVPSVDKGEVVWNQQPNPAEFFGQQPQNCMSMIGVAAFDLRYMLQLIHHKNAQSGKAVKTEDLGKFQTQQEDGLKLV